MLRKTLGFLTLFGSMSTLLCCALPALFVSLGAGAVFASLLTRFPQLIFVSEHKKALFVLIAVLLGLGGFLQWNARNLPCPVDPVKARACQSSRRWSIWVYALSVAIFAVGGFFAFIAPILFS